MNDLLIEGKQITITQKPSKIRASTQLHEIKVEGLLNDVEISEFAKLQAWVDDYKKKYNKNLLVKGIRDFHFALPKNKLIYSKYYSYSESCKTEFSNILENLSFFDIYLEQSLDRFTPTFYGSMEEGFMKFEGEFYTSYTDDFIVPIFAWLELFLDHKPKNLRLEFWMKYFNTSASRKLLEFMEILERYNQSNQTEIKIFWYYLEDDKGSLEEGQLYKDEISLCFDIIEVDDGLWRRMNK